MDTVTYPNEEVSSFIRDGVIPLQVSGDQKDILERYNVQWTPTLVITDSEGKEHHRTLGFLSAEEIIPSLLLGIGKANFDDGRFEEALSNIEALITRYPGSGSTPEAIFYRGVALYKSTKDPMPLREAYETLNEKYPGSTWSKRAYPYRLIGE